MLSWWSLALCSFIVSSILVGLLVLQLKVKPWDAVARSFLLVLLTLAAAGSVAFLWSVVGSMCWSPNSDLAAWAAWNADHVPYLPVQAIHAAVLAPSMLNSQPWIWHFPTLSPPWTFLLSTNVTRTLPQHDPESLNLHLALGATIENLHLGLAKVGITISKTHVNPDWDLEDSPHVATLVLFTSNLHESTGWRALYEAIPVTDVYTDKFAPPPFPSTSFMTVHRDSVAKYFDRLPDDVRITWVYTRQELAALSSACSDEVVRHKAEDGMGPGSREAHHWTRKGSCSTINSRDGITEDHMGLPPLLWLVSKALPTAPRAVLDVMGSIGMQAQLDHTKWVGAAVVSVKDPEALSQRLDAGRTLQRIRLWATSVDLASGDLPLADNWSSEQEDNAGWTPVGMIRLGAPAGSVPLRPRRIAEDVTYLGSTGRGLGSVDVGKVQVHRRKPTYEEAYRNVDKHDDDDD